MDLFKKIEIWILYLVLLLSILFAIAYGVLVRQEIEGITKKGSFDISFLSKPATYIARLPEQFIIMLLKPNPILVNDPWDEKRDFFIQYGFNGTSNSQESYLLLSRYDGDEERSVVELVDLRSFEVKKTWRPDINQINALVDTSQPEFETLQRDSNTKRYRIFHPLLTKDGGIIFQNQSPLVKIDKNSKLVWQNQEDAFHHSIEQDHEGNFWVPSEIYPYQVDNRYVGSEYGNYDDDAITKVSPDGKILFQKSVGNILIENNLKSLLFQPPNFKNDPVHLNDIEPVLSDGPHWKQGDVFLSLRNQSMIILYRPSTNKIIWKSVGHLSAQHDVDILDDYRISIFNNNVGSYFDGEKVEGNNEVIIYDFDTDLYSKYFDESLKQYDVRTVSEGRSQILDNNDLFIEEQNYGRILYFNKDKSVQWQYVNRADDENVYLLNWSRILYKPEDINKVRKILEMEN